MRNAPHQGFSLSNLLTQVQLAYRLYQDDRVPTLLKVGVPLGLAAYFVWPIDLIPDFIPVIGQIDDLAMIYVAITLFIRLAPQGIVDEHMRAMGLLGGSPDAPDAGTRLGDSSPFAGPRRTANDVIDAFYKVVNRNK